MIFSRNWLADYVDLPADAVELGRRLTAQGLAVEGMEERGDDLLLDLDVTTNRPDCMNHLGVAREIAVATGAELRPPEALRAGGEGDATDGVSIDGAAGDEHPADAVAVTVEDPADCPRYAARLVRGIRVGPSPDWLVERLASVGLRSINAIVDVTNFVLWETGQPLHAFDLATLAGSEIIVRRGRAGERLTTLDGEERGLDESILVIADRDRAIALAGVMGGLETEVTESTVDILIESAHFDPSRVRSGARTLGMHTDASHRFERGSDPEMCGRAAARAAALMAEIGGGTVAAGAVDVRDDRSWRLAGTLEADRLDAFVGRPIPADEVARALTGLGFALEEIPGGWKVVAPPWRYYDLHPGAGGRGEAGREVYEADLFEEVLRVHGYDDVPSTVPTASGPDAGASPEFDRRLYLRERLAACGLAEAISYGFYGPEADERFPAWGPEDGVIELANPLSALYSLLRRSLVAGLTESASYNLRRGAAAVRLFEVGHLFARSGDGEPRETEAVALVMGGLVGQPWDGPRQLDLFDLKGVVESLVEAFQVGLAFEPAEVRGMVPGTGAFLRVAGKEGDPVGFLGQVDDPEARVELFAAQLETAVLGRVPFAHPVTLPSRFPGIEADLTLTHPREVSWEEIARTVRQGAPEHLVEFGLKDRYEGEGVPDGAVNTTLTFSYVAQDHSLTSEEIQRAQAELARALEERHGWRRSGDG